MSEELRVVAAALISARGLLVAQRPLEKSQGGLWELPGGKVEPGEDDRMALAREIREELHVDVLVGEYVDEHVHAYPGQRIRLVVYRCQQRSTDSPRAAEHLALRWVSAAEVDGLAWAPADVPLLAAVKRLLALTP